MMSFPTFYIALSVMALSTTFLMSPCPCRARSIDADLLAFSLNLEYLTAEFFLYGSCGYGLDVVARNTTKGHPPIGARIANLDRFTREIIYQIGLEEVGHIRVISKTTQGFERPLMDLSPQNFATWINKAFGIVLFPPFNPYANTINFLLASYVFPYISVTNYIDTMTRIRTPDYKRIVSGLLSVQSGQDAIIRTLLYERASMRVHPYGLTVAEFTERISGLRNILANAKSTADGGLVACLDSTTGIILSGDQDSIVYGRSPEESLRILYGTGYENSPGGFFPEGAKGHIARSHLEE